ncbi:MAG: hypothetical protein Q9191_002667 [Dirinaria sp. TL-2023a]
MHTEWKKKLLTFKKELPESLGESIKVVYEKDDQAELQYWKSADLNAQQAAKLEKGMGTGTKSSDSLNPVTSGLCVKLYTLRFALFIDA